MSASTLVVFYGVRAEVQPEELEALKSRTDPRLLAAQRAGLSHHLALAGVPGAKSFLFLGAQLAFLGPDRLPEVTLSWRDLQRIAELTRRQLAAAGVAGEPALHVQWRPAAPPAGSAPAAT